MKIPFLFFICFVASITQAQTAIIAHKSHSGASADFFIDPSGNFGDPQPISRLTQVIRLNDSTYINVYMEEYSGYINHDTIHDAVSYNLNIDSLKRENQYYHVEYINFKDSPKVLKPKTPGYPIQGIDNEEVIQNKAPIDQPAPKKKKKSYLLFLFGITGGGMLLMKLFSRSKITLQSITSV